MKKEELLHEAMRFRQAIEKARDGGEFAPRQFKTERMNKFPYDCCDDTADLFTHYLFQEFGIDSIRVDSEYYDLRLQCKCGHSWQVTEGWLIDLTGDQFDNDPSIKTKIAPVYVGKEGVFHKQFSVTDTFHSRGIECLGSGCWDRMFGLYTAIMKYFVRD